MIGLAGIAVLCGSLLGISTLSGNVVDETGGPVPGARVFMEPGIVGAIRETAASTTGAFSFDDVGPGAVGVFAFAEGRAFGGLHINVAVADEVPPLIIVLAPEDSISGKISDQKGNPIAGAQVTRVALIGEKPVGIPLAKLKRFGFNIPTSGEDGRYTIPNLPHGGVVSIKAAHPRFAHEAVSDISVGQANHPITLYRGLLVEGTVLTRNGRIPVAGITVLINNALPPRDTAITRTDGQGIFPIRLKTGVYQCKATGAGLASAGWQRFTITADQPRPRIVLIVAGTGQIRGKVNDAVTGEPLRGARLSLTTNGVLADIVRTGPTGTFQMRVSEGDSIIELTAPPGYLPPTTKAIGVSVREGAEIELPDMWLAPIPTYRVQVIDANEQPVSGAVITLVRPYQFGWRVTDTEGWAEIRVANLPADGRLVGMAQHRHKPMGALFALDRGAADQGARVQLLSMATLRGRAVNERMQPIEGARVGALFPLDAKEEPLLLWRCATGKDGIFEWDAVVPMVPQRCLVTAGTEESGLSATFNLEPGQQDDIGDIVIVGGADAKSVLNTRLSWSGNRLQCGELPDKKTLKAAPVLVVYASQDEAAMALEGLTIAKRILNDDRLVIVLVVDGAFECEEAAIPVLKGKPPATATTYLIKDDGKVLLETMGLPPLRALQTLLN